MSEPDPSPPPPHQEAPRAAQPWSDAARSVFRPERNRKAGRRRQLERFNDGLASIVLREIEEEQTVGAIINSIIKLVWAPLMFAGAAVLHRYTGGSGFTLIELAAGLSLSIVLGLSFGRLHGELRGDTMTSAPEPDPYGAAQNEVGFTTLGLGDAIPCSNENRPADGCSSHDEGNAGDA